MRNLNYYQKFFAVVIVSIVAIGMNSTAWSHGDKIQIVPETMTTQSGGTLQVKVNGLVGAKKASFSLTGLSGKYDLGEFSINSDDFTQVLQIPADLPAGSYRLTVEGDGNSAKVVITIH
jgi:hypothetical protein